MTGSLARTVLGITFQNPVLLASGTAGYGRELDGVMELERLGGLVTKAVSLEPRRGNPPPRVSEFACGMINSVGLANPGLGSVRQHELPWLADHLSRVQVLVNVVGFREEEYAAVVSGLDDSRGFAGYELNLSCPNTAKGGIEFGAEPDAVARIVGSVRRVTKRPIFAKLSPVLPDVATMAEAARDAGADGVSLVNTMPGYLYNGERPRVGQGNGGISGPALRPVGMLAVRRVAERTRGELPIIGVGGVSTAEHVREYLRSGASLVAIGTAALADPRLPVRIIEDLEHGVIPSGGEEPRSDSRSAPTGGCCFECRCEVPRYRSGRQMTELILALDTPDAKSALGILDQVSAVQWVKVGSILFVREGPAFVRSLVDRGLDVFLDLKWHDIPNTVSGAVANARDLGVRMATVHALGGVEMMAAASRAAGADVDIVGVTVLTSHTPASFGEATGRQALDLTQDAIRLSRNALEAGLSGVVCSPFEAQAVRAVLGEGPLVVVPGIRRPADPAGDQSRTATPAEAMAAGATHLVVGRPVLQAKDPVAAWAELSYGLE